MGKEALMVKKKNKIRKFVQKGPLTKRGSARGGLGESRQTRPRLVVRNDDLEKKRQETAERFPTRARDQKSKKRAKTEGK